jgi:uncharacterized protein (DUF1330 family)
MPAYLIVLRKSAVVDPNAMAKYRHKTREIKSDVKFHPKVIYGTTTALEGTEPEGVVMLEFPTVEDIQDWHNSPGYHEALPHRLSSADYRIYR